MAIQSKETLKEYFIDGATPDASEFGHLIESSLNLAEEGTQSLAGALSASSIFADNFTLDSFNFTSDIITEFTESNTFGSSSETTHHFSGSIEQSGSDSGTSYFLDNLTVGITSTEQNHYGGLAIYKAQTLGFSNNPLSQSITSSLLISGANNYGQLSFDTNEIVHYGNSLFISSQGDDEGKGNITLQTGITDYTSSGAGILYISSSGNVGIGTNTPNKKLEVIGNISASGNITSSGLYVVGDVSASGTIYTDNLTSDLGTIAISAILSSSEDIVTDKNISASGELYISSSLTDAQSYAVLVKDLNTGKIHHTGSYGVGGSTDGDTIWQTDSNGAVLITSTNNVGIGGASDPTYKLKVHGTMVATADVIAYVSSDKRFKDNIKPISNPIEKIKQIGGYSFDWNDNQNIHIGKDYGVIAQEIEEILPELVQTREDGYKGVKYDRIVSLLIEAIKDQQKQIDELKKLI